MTPIPSADRYEITTESIRYSGATIAPNKAIRISSTTPDGHGDDEPDVVIVIVTCVPKHSGKSRYRYQVVVIAADEKDGVIYSRAGHHRAHQHNGLIRNAKTELRHPATMACVVTTDADRY